MSGNEFIKLFRLKWLVSIIIIVVTWVNFNQERWLSRSVIDHDVAEYYIYLPAVFIEHDLSLSFVDRPEAQNGKVYWVKKTADGRNVAKMTMGTALSYLPFFLVVHVVTLATGSDSAGFSAPYQFAVLFSSLFYFVLGVLFLWKFMLKFFSERLSWLAIFSIVFGTNIFYYLTIGAGLSHPVGFFLFSALLFYLFKWRDQKSLKLSILVGLIIGLMVLVRPVNALASALVIFVALKDFFEKKGNGSDLYVLIKNFAVMTLFCLFAFVPQLIYWKYATGQFFFNSYMEEGFYFLRPHIIDGLFGFRKGWFVYTPLALIAIGGFFLKKKENSLPLIPIFLFILLYIYVCFSWWCWWYGGTFGQRAMIDIYPLLVPGLALLFAALNPKSNPLKKTAWAVFVFVILFNLFQTMQAKYNIIHYDSMTREAYMDALFRTTRNPDREKFLKHPDYEKALRGEKED